MAGKKNINYEELIGTKFNKWTVLSYYTSKKFQCIILTCVCDCGTISDIQSQALRKGASKCCKSCAVLKHGLRNTPEYRSWNAARNRCNNLNNKDYKDYGGRGIKFSSQWDSFEEFLKDMGKRPEGKYTLDRINNEGHYEPGNCRWATYSQQNSNQRRRRIKT